MLLAGGMLFTACKPKNPGSPEVDSNKIGKVRMVDTYEGGSDILEYEFFYDEYDNVNKYTISISNASEVILSTADITYEDNKVIIERTVVKLNTGASNDKTTITADLNEDGYIISGKLEKSDDTPEETRSIIDEMINVWTAAYTTDGRLSTLQGSLSKDGVDSFLTKYTYTWNNGNMTNINFEFGAEETPTTIDIVSTFGDLENSANIDLVRMLAGDFFLTKGDPDGVLAAIGLYGKGSDKLNAKTEVSQATADSDKVFSYKFNKYNRLSEITFSDYTYKITYKE